MIDFIKACELARKVRVSQQTVTSMARRGAIPGAVLIGSSWRFDAGVIEEWLKSGGGDAARKNDA